MLSKLEFCFLSRAWALRGAAIAEEEEEEGDDLEEGTALARSDSMATSSTFWDSLLRPHHERLRKEEEVPHHPCYQRKHVTEAESVFGSEACDTGQR